ncbi:MAG TPA: GntG family PLP-dependent aldolase, partial [Dehalococcoidia bacterium]|nr:GntG family PLP-dependent aldolase [Dehalococcoidia bacterium]
MTPTIDLRSDTVTLPTPAMRQAMAEAEVGDDVFREDPTVNRLEERSAELLGKEAALFTASGTMSNLIAALTHTQRGDEVIAGSEAHLVWSEVAGAATLGGLQIRTVPQHADGTIDPRAIESAIRTENVHHPRTGLICLENTQNRCGGAVMTVEETAAIGDLAHARGIPVHLDGARLFNAAIALERPARDLAAPADSVGFCLSKGLGAPVGSLLAGRRDFIDRARKYRKMLGGGMRQAGVIAAAGLVALDTMIDRLAEDHAHARRLAIGLAAIPGLIVAPNACPTNIVMVRLPEPAAASLAARLAAEGLLVSQ